MIWVYIIGAIVLLLGFSVFFGAPYVPSRRRDVQRMFDELYPLSKSDVLIDVGSGDGIILREASKRGAKAIGYEVSPLLVAISKWLSRGDEKVSVSVANFWQAKFPDDTTVIYAFSVERDAKKLTKKIQSEAERLKKPLTLICYGSPLPNVLVERNFEAYHLYRFQPQE
ncbi:MAG: methyltransferase domain-containing protein [Patescibacteria group bacterium]